MAESRREHEKKKNIVSLTVLLMVFLSICAVSLLVRFRNRFEYEKSLEATVLEVDGEAVTLREFGYYILSLEDFVNEQAVLYDPKNPIAYWNAHFRAGLKSAFIASMAKKTAYETCICDKIYYKMALESGYSLDDAEREKARKLAETFIKEQSDEQLVKTGISPEMILNICEKKVLIAKYAKDYVQTIDFDGYSGYREELISAGGEYYEREIRPKHAVKINDRIRTALRFGRITVNQRGET